MEPRDNSSSSKAALELAPVPRWTTILFDVDGLEEREILEKFSFQACVMQRQELVAYCKFWKI